MKPALAAILAFFCFSCGSSDAQELPIVGNWTIRSTQAITFSNDGRYLLDHGPANRTGNYTLSDSLLILDIDGNERDTIVYKLESLGPSLIVYKEKKGDQFREDLKYMLRSDSVDIAPEDMEGRWEYKNGYIEMFDTGEYVTLNMSITPETGVYTTSLRGQAVIGPSRIYGVNNRHLLMSSERIPGLGVYLSTRKDREYTEERFADLLNRQKGKGNPQSPTIAGSQSRVSSGTFSESEFYGKWKSRHKEKFAGSYNVTEHEIEFMEDGTYIGTGGDVGTWKFTSGKVFINVGFFNGAFSLSRVSGGIAQIRMVKGKNEYTIELWR
ncbi:MAG: hypothetical protein AAF391_06235 [Bacteroidota bacterium]